MAVLTLDSRWRRMRRRLRPITSRVPGGHVVTEAATYARLALPFVPRPARRFVIFAQGRSGSTLLVDLLNAHPRLVCDDEILTFRRRWPARYATACSVGHRAEVWGFKVKIYQLLDAQQMAEPGAFLRHLHEDGWSVVHLHRGNVVRQALSSMVAAARGGHYHQAAGASAPPPVVIDPAELVARAAERDRFVALEEEALRGVPHLRVVYEDDLLTPAQQQATADRVLTHLGLDPVPVRTKLAKIARHPLDGVANADEVRQALAGTRYGELLEQD